MSPLISPAFSVAAAGGAGVPFAGGAAGLPALFVALAYGEAHESSRNSSALLRDWVAVALVLLAYREMDWFSALPRNFIWNCAGWSGTGLSALSVRDCSGRSNRWARLVPFYLELCYLLVYAVGPFVVAVLYFEQRRELE